MPSFNVRVVPDIAVSGSLLDAMMVWNQTPAAPENGKISISLNCPICL